MKKLCGLACLFSLLLGGVLVAPPSSEAATMTIAGQTANLTPITCPSGFTTCYSILGSSHPFIQTFGTSPNQWSVADVSATNFARVLINDVNTNPACGALTSCPVDKMIISGVKFTKVGPVEGTSKTTNVILSHLFSVSNAIGNYYWSATQTGNFDPPGITLATGDRLTLTMTCSVTKNGVTTNCTTLTIDTGNIAAPISPTGNGQPVYLQRSSATGGRSIWGYHGAVQTRLRFGRQ